MEDCIKRIIDLCNDTQTPRNKMCRDIGIPPTTFSNYVIRGGKPTYDMMKKISAYFGVSMEYIDTGIEPSRNAKKEIEELSARISALPDDKREHLLSVIYKLLGTFE